MSTAVSRIAALCQEHGFTGVGWDLEGFDGRYQQNVYAVCTQLRAKHKLKVMLTILLGDKSSWSYLLSQQPACYDYVTLMLYNGGMYAPGGEGGACVWEGWAETFLMQCPAEVSESCTSAPNCARTGGAHKVLLGVITDASKGVCDASCAARAQALVRKHGGGGIMNWVVPGWGANRGGASKAFFCDLLPAVGAGAGGARGACAAFPP